MLRAPLDGVGGIGEDALDVLDVEQPRAEHELVAHAHGDEVGAVVRRDDLSRGHGSTLKAIARDLKLARDPGEIMCSGTRRSLMFSATPPAVWTSSRAPTSRSSAGARGHSKGKPRATRADRPSRRPRPACAVT
jgi:hypothetical protein